MFLVLFPELSTSLDDALAKICIVFLDKSLDNATYSWLNGVQIYSKSYMFDAPCGFAALDFEVITFLKILK
jgi:hypothetical protein